MFYASVYPANVHASMYWKRTFCTSATRTRFRIQDILLVHVHASMGQYAPRRYIIHTHVLLQKTTAFIEFVDILYLLRAHVAKPRQFNDTLTVVSASVKDVLIHRDRKDVRTSTPSD